MSAGGWAMIAILIPYLREQARGKGLEDETETPVVEALL
jgi:hypothetical protein